MMAMHGLTGAAQAAYQQDLAAKQCGMERNTFTSADEPRQVLMGALSRALEIQGSRIADVLGTVTYFLDRVFGPQPDTAGATTTATPQPVGMLHEIERHLSHNDRMLAELEQKIRRLGDIA